MRIACIGWGSLIWNPGSLKIQNKWFDDGPILPIEFTRISEDDRVTLIIDPEGTLVRTLWAFMTVTEIAIAKSSLQNRENVKNIDTIKSVSVYDTNSDQIVKEIKNWLEIVNIDAAVWTGLSYSKKTNNKRPTVDDIIDHLRNKLDYNAKKVAEEYIRKAPKQIDTEYRRRIEMEFGWTPILMTK